jgi:hypothetical protein
MPSRLSTCLVVVLVASGCAGSTTVFGYPVNAEARIEQRASAELSCRGGKHGGATIRSHHESDDGDAYTVCCARGTERCLGYFCARRTEGEPEACERQSP